VSRRRGLGLVCLAVALLFAGCSLGRGPAPPRSYTLLGAPEAGGAGSAGAGAQQSTTGVGRGRVLRLGPFEAPAWLSDARIYYRLLYHSESAIAAYADARWVDPPAEMLRSLVMDAFRDRGDFAAVIGPEDPVRADLALRLELLDLEQRFATPERSVGVLRVRATLLDPRDRSAVAQRDFAYRVPAPSADASGGVAAERKAARAFAGDLVRWVETRLPAQPGTPSRSSR